MRRVSTRNSKQYRNERNNNVIMGFNDFSQKDGLGKKRLKAPILKIKHHLRQRYFCYHNKIELYKTIRFAKLNEMEKMIESKLKLQVYSVISCKTIYVIQRV